MKSRADGTRCQTHAKLILLIPKTPLSAMYHFFMQDVWILEGWSGPSCCNRESWLSLHLKAVKAGSYGKHRCSLLSSEQRISLHSLTPTITKHILFKNQSDMTLSIPVWVDAAVFEEKNGKMFDRKPARVSIFGSYVKYSIETFSCFGVWSNLVEGVNLFTPVK